MVTITPMAADHVVVTFTTSSRQLADTMAAEATNLEFPCCAQIEGPVRSKQRWHGHTHVNEEWRVEIEATEAGAKSLVDHLEANHHDDVRNLSVADNLTPVFDGRPESQ